MTSTQATLTPTTNQTPVVVEIEKELSGAQWVARFPGSTSTTDLTQPFRTAVANFIAALESAGAVVTNRFTWRPPERAYLMHWSWRIVHGANPHGVPPMAGVNIEWAHANNNLSVQAARSMVNGYQIQNLQIAPSLATRHTQRKAIDMSIAWTGVLHISNVHGEIVTITSLPRTGMNVNLHAVGAGYGVIKFLGGATDRPHWSTDGH